MALTVNDIVPSSFTLSAVTVVEVSVEDVYELAVVVDEVVVVLVVLVVVVVCVVVFEVVVVVAVVVVLVVVFFRGGFGFGRWIASA